MSYTLFLFYAIFLQLCLYVKILLYIYTIIVPTLKGRKYDNKLKIRFKIGYNIPNIRYASS